MNGQFVLKECSSSFSVEVINDEALEAKNLSVSNIDMLIPQSKFRISQFIQRSLD
jgi:hypothetical protein